MLCEATQTPWHKVLQATTAEGFWWMTGFEGSNIPHIQADEYEWTQHYTLWEQDLFRVRNSLGVKRLRYTLPWYRLNPERGRFDWEWSDRVIERAAELGLELIINPIHFGTPMWLEDSFANPDFPQYAAEYFAQIARRYGQQLKFYTPHNEPLITALFAGDFGHWPPYRHGLDSYVELAGNIARQIILSVEAVRQEIPEAVMIHVEAGEYYGTRHTEPWILKDAWLRNERRFLFYDLISGRVGPEHPLLPWLTRHGMTDRQLSWFQERAIELDVVGVDFYPHCEAWLYLDEQGKLEQNRDFGSRIVRSFRACRDSNQVRGEVDLPLSMSGLLRQYYQRYRRPVMLTETDFCGQNQDKATFIEYTLQEIQHLREEGLPVLGFTWWPAIDHLNWDKALKERGHIHPVGLWELKPHPDGILQRVETSALQTLRHAILNPHTSVGAVNSAANLQF